MLILIVLAPLLIPLNECLAQLDSSSAVLLRASPANESAPAPKSLDSSRYRVRLPESRKAVSDDLDEKPGTVIATPVPTKAQTKIKNSAPPTSPPTVEVPLSDATPKIEPEIGTSETPSPPKASPANPQMEVVTEKPVTEQFRMLILGGSDEDISDYKKQIHPQDPRTNLLDISLAPGYFYQASQSSYQYRRYNTNGPGLGLGMSLWLTPFFGVQTDWFSSLNASQKGPGGNVVAAELQDFQAGIRFRKHFGYSRRAAFISWGLDFHDATHKVSRDGTNAVGKRTQGFSLGLEAVIPTSVGYAHQFQIDFRPTLTHGELISGNTVRSGTKNETSGVALGVGGQWTLDRRNQLFWRTQLSVERNLFSGQASAPDPSTGQTPQGVSVNNTMLMFQFGFKWGS
jgi:hypothetical protein